MIGPLSVAHFFALGAFLFSALLLFVNVNLVPLPLGLFVLICCIAPLFTRFSFFLPIISKGKQGSRGVSLTFDDGPDPEVTPLVLELLARHGITATFFVTGLRAERYPDLMRAILAGGHAIGNHSYSHFPFLMLKGRNTLRREIVSAQRALLPFGIVPLAFRPPVGITSPLLWPLLLDNGMFCLNFSCRAPDLGNRLVVNLAGRLLAKVTPGDIILLHDVAPQQWDVAHLLQEFSKLIEGLQGRGVEILPLGQFIGREVMKWSASDSGPGRAESNANELRGLSIDLKKSGQAGREGEEQPAAVSLESEPQYAAVAVRTLVVIPVYNHARTLRGVALGALAQGLDVLVVDDGSTDGSLESVADLPLQRHRLPLNLGKGGAILAGAQLARDHGYQAILTIDADGQHDPADAPLLLECAASSWPCIVIGARRMETLNVPRSSLFGRDFSNFWVRIECGQTLPDTQSGYRLYPVEFLESSRFLSRRYTFEIEVLVRGRWAGLPVLSVPVAVYYPPGDERISHFHKFKDNLRLSFLHSYLVTRSLIPWPHRRLFGEDPASERLPSIYQPAVYFRALSREHSSAGQLAAAVWVGIFLGALPIMPFATAIIIYVCFRLHLNKLAAVGASNVCAAPFVPFLCIQLGHYLVYGSFWYEFNRNTLLHQLQYRLWEWLLGAMIIGPLLGAAFALLTNRLVRSVRKRTVTIL